MVFRWGLSVNDYCQAEPTVAAAAAVVVAEAVAAEAVVAVPVASIAVGDAWLLWIAL